MNLQRIAIPLLIAALLWIGWTQYGWPGLAAIGGGLVMWLLLHVTRLLTVMKRAADRPKGWVASAVMLNARLKAGVTLMHVMAMTKSMGDLQSDEGEQPERFRWTDNGGSSVTASFAGGRLVQWQLSRPGQEERSAP
jgi:hypothetical protein